MAKIKQINPGQALFSGSVQVNGFTASTGITTCTAALTTALSGAGRGGVTVPLQVSLTEDAIGVITTGANNLCELFDSATKEKLKDGLGNELYGRLSESAGAYSLSYYSLVAGVETGFNFTAPKNIDFRFNYRFDGASLPTDFVLSANARSVNQDPSGRGGGSPYAEKLTVTALNTLTDLAKTPAANTTLRLIVNGESVDAFDGSSAPFELAGKTIVWSATNAKYSLETTDRVIARYYTNE